MSKVVCVCWFMGCGGCPRQFEPGALPCHTALGLAHTLPHLGLGGTGSVASGTNSLPRWPLLLPLRSLLPLQVKKSMARIMVVLGERSRAAALKADQAAQAVLVKGSAELKE